MNKFNSNLRKKIFIKLFLLISFLAANFFTSCRHELPSPGLFNGQVLNLHNGQIESHELNTFWPDPKKISEKNWQLDFYHKQNLWARLEGNKKHPTSIKFYRLEPDQGIILQNFKVLRQ